MKSEEIAKIAGVSRSTVSRVINNYTNVPDETKKKVLEVIEKYNYQPNTCARVLAGKKSDTIGLFVVSIADAENPNRLYKNDYFNQFTNAIVDCANSRGYYVLINIIYCESDYSRVNEIFLQKRIDGGIVLGTEKEAETLIKISKKGCPIALIDYDAEEIRKNKAENENLILVGSRDYEGAAAAVEYLIELGHTDIGLLAGRMTTYSGRQRYKAFFDTMKKHNLEINDQFVLHGDFIKSKTSNEVHALISKGRLPSAIFSSNDDMAITAIELFKENNIRVPEDISIIGFDNITLASLVKPSLTTVETPIFDIAEKTVKELISNIQKTGKGFKSYSYNTKMVIRETCAKK
ncbi:LacI family transcriptional regulator [Ruminiclostridium sufflavum DSM 19573]|uniref:LacI family transcriptional regulator n=1 Tax=Ruminiclostridium sufflavum DSM 19573 TaxID=1121337 RepID=A0A318XST8_9FIRM|nr:LacI family DNA-binding transcriptional regulator [Ruminiclostridium sufflavum]PYG89762.1 LacI family transcriptional regulator [Ruminiclostridium sufflavum DSM 19573]